YTRYVQKARRTQAVTALLRMASREEGYFSRENKYTDDLIELGYSDSDTFVTGGGYYKIETSLDPDIDYANYTITATAIGAQVADVCAEFTLDWLGRKEATQADCWPSRSLRFCRTRRPRMGALAV